MKIEVLVRNSKNNKREPRNYFSYIKTLSVVCMIGISQLSYAQTGTWAKLTNLAGHDNDGTMVLMTDGTVLCHNATGGTYGSGWDKLTPSATGSYLNGTWTTMASMNEDRTVFGSQVLPNGKLFVCGGEYGPGDTAGEVYDPVANTWTRTEKVPGTQNGMAAGTSDNIYDGNTEMLPDGRVLVGPQIGPDPSNDCLYYTPSTNTWAIAPTAPQNHDEAAWIKLPDSSILFIGIGGIHSCRYRPQTSTWIADATAPDSIYDPYGEEAGSAMLLPNGNAIFFGATTHNIIYTPTGTTAKGSWSRAADFPTISGSGVGMVDAPSIILPNGHIMMAVSPVGTGAGNNEFLAPTYFLEYDYVTNTFTQVTSDIPGTSSPDLPGLICQQTLFLLLPDGTALMGINQDGAASKQYYIYTEAATTSPIAAGKPVINSILPDGCPYYKLTGKLFNGISEGNGYGDDWQNYTNYPLVRLTGTTGNVYFCKTTDWNRIGAVRTDSLEDTTVFETPAALPAGTYSLVVIANGFASSPTIFTTLQASASVIANATCGNSGSASYSVSGGLSPYTYSWAAPGGNNADATGLSAGTYTVSVTDLNGCEKTASVTITESSTLTSAPHTTANVNCNGSSDGSVSVTVSGGVAPYTYLWTGGATTNSVSGLSAGSYNIIVSDQGGCSETETTTITQPALLGASCSLVSNANCGGNSGSASSIASGGTSPYTYSWAPSGGNNVTATGLSIGTYTISVTDNCSASSSASVVISGPTALNALASASKNVNCYGSSTGAATSSVSGGGTPYTYSWNGGSETTANISGVSAGTYTLVVNDACGNSYTTTTTITEPASALSSTASTTGNVSCNGGNTGTASATASGGTAPYTYSWTGGGGSSAEATGLVAGNYTLTVTDNKGCNLITTIVVTQPAIMNVTTSSVEALSGACNGSASVNVNGGTVPYTYSWDNTTSSTTPTITDQCAGTYCCLVSDNNGCMQSVCVTINSNLGVAEISNVSSINIYPDPNTGSFTVAGVTQGQIIQVYNALGQQLSTVNADKPTMYFNISNQSDGIYLVRILSKDGSLVTQRKIIKVE